MRSAYRFCALTLAIFVATTTNAAPTLTITGGAVYTASSSQASVTAIKPTLAAPPGAGTDYKTAFDKWNTGGGGQGWTLSTAGTLGSDTIFNVSLYKAYCVGLSGGVEIRIDYTQGAGAPNPATQGNVTSPTTAFWTQSIVTTDPLGANTSPYLDIAGDAVNNGGSTFLPPLYPYQYTGTMFYDKPKRTVTPGGPTITWTATAYLASRNLDTKTLTVYDGVTWGFSITPVPEPTSMVALAIGGAALLARRRRRKI